VAASTIFLGSLAANILANNIGTQTSSYAWAWWALLLLAYLITIIGAGWATWRKIRPPISAIAWPAGCDFLEARAFKKLTPAADNPDESMYARIEQPTWGHIIAAQDLRRSLTDRIIEAAEANPHPASMNFQLVRAQAGNGKTSFLLRLAYELMQAGYSVLLNLEDSSPIDLDALRAACQAAAVVGRKRRKRIYLLLDNVFPVHKGLFQRLHTLPISNLTIIATSRFDAVPTDIPELRPALLDQPTVELGDLTPAEATELVERVQRHGLLRATDVQSILASAIEGSEPLLDVVLALTHDRGLERYVRERLTAMNGGEDPGWQRRAERLPRLQLYEAVARNHAWGLDTPLELLPTLSGLELSQIRLSPNDPWSREYLRPTRDGRWRTEHELVAREAVAYLDGPAADPIAHLATTLTALAPLANDPVRAPVVATFVGRLVLRATQGPLPWDTTIEATAVPITRLRDVLPTGLIARFHTFASPRELVDLYIPAYLALEYWTEAAEAAGRAIKKLARSPNQQDIARLQSARSLQQLGQAQGALTELNALLTKIPADPDALRQRAMVYADLGNLSSAFADFKQALLIRPNDPDILLDRAVVYQGQGQYADALTDLESALAARANDPDILNTRGLVFAGMDEFDKALADYNLALELRPDDPVTLCNRANLYFNDGAYEQAIADYTSALALAPGDPDILFYRGTAHHAHGHYAPALADYTAALTAAPDEVLTLLSRAEIYANLGDRTLAFTDLDTAQALQPANSEIQALREKFNASRIWTLQDYNAPLLSTPDNTDALSAHAFACFQLGWYLEAERDWSRLLQLLPDHPQTLAIRGETYRNMGRYEEALADSNHSLQLLPDHPQTLAIRGETYRNMGRYEEALANFNRSLQLLPDHPQTLAVRGDTYRRMGRYEEALANFNRSLQLLPDHPLILTNRSITYRLMDRYEEALADSNHSLQLLPDYPVTLTNRGSTYRNMGRYEEALADFNRSLQLLPDDPFTLTGRGSAYGSIDRYEEALADFNRSLQLRPDDPITLTNRGITYRLMGHYEEALADFNRSLQLRPDDPDTLTSRGVSYVYMDLYEEALIDYDRSLQLRTDDPVTLTNRGIVYRSMGRYGEALADFDRSIQLDPTYGLPHDLREQMLGLKPPPGKTWDEETLG
jgi:tetratricopeptide (TPR) repeat protein